MPIGYTTYACELDFAKIGTATFTLTETGGGGATGVISIGPSDGKMFIGTASDVLGYTYTNLLDVLKTKLEAVGAATYTPALDPAVATGIIPKLTITGSGGGVTSFALTAMNDVARNLLGFYATTYSGLLSYTGDTSPWWWIHQSEPFLSDWPADREESDGGANDSLTHDGIPYSVSKSKVARLFDAIVPCEPGSVIWQMLAPKFNADAYRAFTWEDLFPAIRGNGLLAITFNNANGIPDQTNFVKLRQDGCFFEPTLRAAGWLGHADIPIKARLIKRTLGVYVPPVPPSWTPLDLGSKLKIWLPPAGLPGSGSISQWSDSSGNGFHLTQATGSKQPTVTTINGKLAALFDGIDDELVRASAFSSIVTASAGFMAGVFRYTAIASTTTNYWEGSAGLGDSLGYLSLAPAHDVMGAKKMGGGYIWDGNGKPGNGSSTTVTLPNTFYCEVQWTGSNVTSRINNVDTVAAAGNVQSLSGTILMGRSYNGGNSARWFTGSIAEPIACNAVPSAGELANIRAYYASQYGVITT